MDAIVFGDLAAGGGGGGEELPGAGVRPSLQHLPDLKGTYARPSFTPDLGRDPFVGPAATRALISVLSFCRRTNSAR